MVRTVWRTTLPDATRPAALGAALGVPEAVLLGGILLDGWTVFLPPPFGGPLSDAAPLLWPAILLSGGAAGAAVGYLARSAKGWLTGEVAPAVRRLPTAAKIVVAAVAGAVLLGLAGSYVAFRAATQVEAAAASGGFEPPGVLFLRILAAAVIAGALFGALLDQCPVRNWCLLAITALRPSRPWVRSRRVWTAAVMMLLVAYPLSLGVVSYLGGAGLLPGFNGKGTWTPAAYFYGPLYLLPESAPKQLIRDYDRWAYELGYRHASRR